MNYYSNESNYLIPSTNEVDDFNGLNQKLNDLDTRQLFPFQYSISLDGRSIGMLSIPAFQVTLGTIKFI